MAPPLVVQITEAFTGGVERHLTLLARTLPARGFPQHCLISLRRDPAARTTAETIRERGTPVTEIPMAHAPCLLPDYVTYARIKTHLRRLRPALVHTHAAKAGILGRRAAMELGLPCVHTPHVLPFERGVSPLAGAVYMRIERRAARWCDRIVCLSAAQEDHALAAGLAPLERLAVIPNGIDAACFAPASSEERRAARERFRVDGEGPVLGTAGRLVRQKRLELLVETAARVREACPGVRWLVAGSGREGERVRYAARRLGMQRAVHFLGRVRTMRHFYAALDAFVLTSRWEGLPYVLLEAQAAGVPVVATPTDGAATLIEDGESGWIRPADPGRLAEAVVDLLGDPAEAGRRASWGRERVRTHFRLDDWAEAHARLYSAVTDS